MSDLRTQVADLLRRADDARKSGDRRLAASLATEAHPLIQQIRDEDEARIPHSPIGRGDARRAVSVASLLPVILLCLAASLPALEQDKKDHAKAGAAIAVLSYAGLSVATDMRPWQKALASSLVATAAGWGKELYDRQGHGTYEARDAWMTGLGGAGGAGAVFAIELSF